MSSLRSWSLCWFYLCSRLFRCTMAETAPPTSWARSRAHQCKICRSPAPPTICGLNFPLTRRAQQRGSGSYTTVSHFSPARRILNVALLSFSQFNPTSEQNPKEHCNWPWLTLPCYLPFMPLKQCGVFLHFQEKITIFQQHLWICFSLVSFALYLKWN